MRLACDIYGGDDVVYDVVDYEVLDESRCSPKNARKALQAVLVRLFGETAVFPDALIGRNEAEKADFFVRAERHWPMVFFVVSRPDDQQAYQQAINAGRVWGARDAVWFIVFERDCLHPRYIEQWVRLAMEKAVRTKG